MPGGFNCLTHEYHYNTLSPLSTSFYRHPAMAENLISDHMEAALTLVAFSTGEEGLGAWVSVRKVGGDCGWSAGVFDRLMAGCLGGFFDRLIVAFSTSSLWLVSWTFR